MAEGISGLVLDVKTGSGAFLKTETEATELALLMIDIARRMNKQAVALITDMNQPLGRMVGNSLEVIEAVETLKGQGPDDLAQLCRELSAEMLVLGRAAKNLDDGRHRYNELLDSGAALGKMREIIEAQHGDARAVDDYSLLPQATQSRTVTSEKDGFVQSLDTEALGHASMLLGAGRTRLDTPIDLAVGLRIDAKIGESVEAGGPLVTMHFNDLERALEAEAIIRKAFVVGPEPVPAPRLIKNVLR
jgi:pyrimidine-nucleoside phosphorylase